MVKRVVFLVIFLIIFSFALFHVQWLLWIVPFLVILCIKKPDLSRLIFFLGAIAFVVPLLFQDRYMSISLFRIYSTWFDMLPTPFTLVQKVYDPLNFQFVFLLFFSQICYNQIHPFQHIAITIFYL